MNKMRKSGAGQALVIFALSFTALFGLVVVGIEGGMMYVDRRQLQNAADAAALAGAYALESLPLPTYSPAHQKALQILVDNLPATTMPGTIPSSASFSQSLGNGYTTQVVTVGGTGWDSYKVTVLHVFSLQLGTGLGFANPTLVAMAKAQSGTYPFALILFQNDADKYDNNSAAGNGSLELLKASAATAGGGGFSNEGFNIGTGGGAHMTFSPCGSAGDLWAVSESSASGANLEARTTGQTGDSTCTVHPAAYPKLQSTQLPFPNYPEPAVTGPTYGGTISVSSGTTYLCPGTYNATALTPALTMSSTPTVILMPGVFRFTGGATTVQAINISGGTLRTAKSTDFPAAGTYINCSGTPTAPVDGDYGVIIELQPYDCTANDFYVNGGSAIIDLSPSPKYNKISFYVEPRSGATWATWNNAVAGCPYVSSPLVIAGTHAINISGSAAYSIRGAIYGPGENAALAGNGAGYGVGQALLWTCLIVGNGVLKENYDPAYLPYFRGLIQ